MAATDGGGHDREAHGAGTEGQESEGKNRSGRALGALTVEGLGSGEVGWSRVRHLLLWSVCWIANRVPTMALKGFT